MRKTIAIFIKDVRRLRSYILAVIGATAAAAALRYDFLWGWVLWMVQSILVMQLILGDWPSGGRQF